MDVGFEYGDQLETIIGARMIADQLHLYCSWVGKTQCSFVPAKIANTKVPATVIHFYESRLRFDPLPTGNTSSLDCKNENEIKPLKKPKLGDKEDKIKKQTEQYSQKIEKETPPDVTTVPHIIDIKENQEKTEENNEKILTTDENNMQL